MAKSAKSYSETYLGVKIVADASQYQKTMLSAGKAGQTAFTPTQRAMSQLTTNTSKATTAMNALTKAGRDGLGAFQSLYTGSLLGDVIAFADSKLSVVEATKSETDAQRELAEAMVNVAKQDLDSLKIQYDKIQANKAFYQQTNQMKKFNQDISEINKRDLAATEALINAETNLASVRQQSWGKNLFNAMGGWVGAATLAASAVVYLVSQMKTASQRADELSSEVDKLSNNLDKLGQSGLDNAIFLLEQKLEQQKEVAEELADQAYFAEKRQERLSETTNVLVKSFNDLVGATTRVKGESLASAAAIEKQNSEIEKTASAIDKANRLKLGLPDPSKLAAEQAKALDKLKSQLDGLRTPIERNNAAFIESAAVLDEGFNQNLITTEQYHQRLELLQSEHNENMAKLASENAVSLFDKLQGQYDPIQALKNQHEQELAELDSYHQTDLLNNQQYLDLKIAALVKYNEEYEKLTKKQQDTNLQAYQVIIQGVGQISNSLSSALEQAGDRTSSAYKALFAVNKAIAIGQAIINTQLAYTAALSTGGAFLGVPLAEWVKGMGYAAIGVMAGTSVAGMAHNGIDKVPREGTWLLDKGERVLSPRQNADFTDFMKSGTNSPRIVINNYAGAEVSAQYDDREDIIRISVNRAVKAISNQLSSGTGETSRALRQRWNTNTKTD